MQPSEGGVQRRVRVRAVVVGVVLTSTVVMTGCVEVPVTNSAPDPSPGPAPQEELAKMPELPASELQTFGGDVAAFLTEDRNTYCAITTEQGGIINSPVDPRLSGGQRDDSILEVPAVYCELARYPEPPVVTDDCYGTNLGFKGGTVLLTAEAVSYGGCRVGMTPMEAELGPGSGAGETRFTRLPVLEDGTAVDLHGFRCGSVDRGVVCVGSASGRGFLASAEEFAELTPSAGPER